MDFLEIGKLGVILLVFLHQLVECLVNLLLRRVRGESKHGVETLLRGRHSARAAECGNHQRREDAQREPPQLTHSIQKMMKNLFKTKNCEVFVKLLLLDSSGHFFVQKRLLLCHFFSLSIFLATGLWHEVSPWTVWCLKRGGENSCLASFSFTCSRRLQPDVDQSDLYKSQFTLVPQCSSICLCCGLIAAVDFLFPTMP